MYKVVVAFDEKYSNVFTQLNHVEAVTKMLVDMLNTINNDNAVLLPTGDDHIIVRSFLVKKLSHVDIDIIKKFDVSMREVLTEEIKGEFSKYLNKSN